MFDTIDTEFDAIVARDEAEAEWAFVPEWDGEVDDPNADEAFMDAFEDFDW